MKWEYKIINTGDFAKFTKTDELQEELNRYGQDGWELVDFVYPTQPGEGWEPKLDIDSVIFKRQIGNN